MQHRSNGTTLNARCVAFETKSGLEFNLMLFDIIQIFEYGIPEDDFVSFILCLTANAININHMLKRIKFVVAKTIQTYTSGVRNVRGVYNPNETVDSIQTASDTRIWILNSD